MVSRRKIQIALWILSMVLSLCTPAAKAFYPCSPPLMKLLPNLCTIGHYQITFLGASGLGFSPSALARVADANVKVDTGEVYFLYNGAFFVLDPIPGVYKATDHFDHDPNVPITVAGMTPDQQVFLNSRAEVLKKRDDIVAILKAGDCSRLGEALDELGQALHSVQDLYAHSNYADQNYQSKNVGLDSTAQGVLDAALLNTSVQPPTELKLTLYAFSLTEPENPTGDCNTYDPSVYCHEFWAKDNAGKNPISGSVNLDYSVFNAAVVGAQNATANFIKSIITAVTSSQWNLLVGTYGTSSSPCMPPQPPCSQSLSVCVPTDFNGSVITPGDPNDKAGSQGFGSQQYISGATPLRYAVQYGNEITASAPAAKVVIIDPIDIVHVDLSTFVVGPISFGSQLIIPPSIPGDFFITVDLRPANNLLVSIQTHIDRNTGILSYTFQSLDPATNLPPTDPTAGFLPPGATGSVFFTAMAKAGVTTDTAITNQATVVFDALTPIPTPTWSNTIDNSAPVSHVLALPSNERTVAFPVSWSGTDTGSGVGVYTIYASDNGSTFTPWLTGTVTTSASFTGQVGHTYGFYSIATDNVGNTEPAKTSPEATVQVVPATTATALQASATVAIPTQPITFTATITGPTGNTTAPTGTVTFLLGSSTLGTETLNASGVATLAVPLPAGSDSISAQYSGDTNFAPSTSNPVAVIVTAIATNTTVVSSAATANLGVDITFTAKVTPATGTAAPTGTVTFSDGSTVLGPGALDGSGTATYNTASLASGTHMITAAYSGDAIYIGSTSSAFTQTVIAPGYSLSVAPSTLTITQGQSGQAVFAVTPVGGFKSQISLNCSGLPAYSTCTFSPATVAPDGTNTAVTSTLTIATDVSTASVTTPATSGSRPGQAREKLLAFLLIGLPYLIWGRRKFKGNPGFRAFSLVCGIALGMAATSMLSCGGKGKMSTNTPQGTDTITVTASSGGTAETASFTLTVQ
jgi:hypothetical protein